MQSRECVWGEGEGSEFVMAHSQVIVIIRIYSFLLLTIV